MVKKLIGGSLNFIVQIAVGYPPPGQVQWMQAPAVIPNCPPGLEYLTQIDQLLIKQQVELLEGMLDSIYFPFGFRHWPSCCNFFFRCFFFLQHSLILKRTISTRF